MAVGDTELIDMLAAETERRVPAVIDGIRDLAGSGRSDSTRVEELRVEVHGLKGASLVVGQDRLAALAKALEAALVRRQPSGEIPPELAETLVAATSALQEGATAASRGKSEPASVENALTALADT